MKELVHCRDINGYTMRVWRNGIATIRTRYTFDAELRNDLTGATQVSPGWATRVDAVQAVQDMYARVTA